jgi:hypothetical protein
LDDRVAFPTHADRIVALATPWTTAEIVQGIGSVQACLADLEANVRPKLATEAMVLQWPNSATAR